MGMILDKRFFFQNRIPYFFSILYEYEKQCFIVCGRVPWLYQYWPGGGGMLLVVLCPGTPEGSTGSDSGFKASQKTGQRRLKVSSDRLAEAGNQ